MRDSLPDWQREFLSSEQLPDHYERVFRDVLSPLATWLHHQHEGWCVGTPPQEEAALRQPVNRMESEQDSGLHWRRFVNRQLQEIYQPLFRTLDRLIMLEAPPFNAVYRWRCLQEDRLSEQTGSMAAAPDRRLMDPAGIQQFLQHFERLTRHALRTVPSIADIVLHMDPGHHITHTSPPLDTLSGSEGHGR